MSRFLAWNLKAYRIFLRLYPHDVRGEFEPEIFDAFENDLLFECSACGATGAIRVWRVALRELMYIGLPAWLQIPTVAVPLRSTTVLIVSQALLFMLSILRGRDFRPGDKTELNSWLCDLAIFAATNAVISFLAAYPRKRSDLISLEIGRSLCWKSKI